MPRSGTIATDVSAYLERRRNGATIEEIAEALGKVRRSPVLRHSVRSSIYQHSNGNGEDLFVRVARGRYELKK